MYHYYGFPYLHKKGWVQVKGRPANDGTFTALEITVAAKDDVKIIRLQGVVQMVDPIAGLVKLSNRQVAIPLNAKIESRSGPQLTLADLKVGDVLRIDGRYENDGSFVPEKLSTQRQLDFNLDKLFGCIEQVSEEQKTFAIFGLPITVLPDTSIELT